MSCPPIDEMGNKYGRLTVVGLSEERDMGRLVWKCQCECGRTTYVLGRLLRSGNTKSCGCMKRQARLKYGRKYMNKNALDKIDDDIL
jgi:hypothetical protein